MRKIFLLFLCLVATLGLYAADYSIRVSAGITEPIKSFTVQDGDTTTNPYNEIIGETLYSEISFSYDFSRFAGFGASAGFQYSNPPHSPSKLFTIPFYADFIISPYIKAVSFPLTFSAGGYAALKGNSIAFGPAARISAAMEFDAGTCSVFMRTQAELLIALSKDFSRTDYNIRFSPVIAGIRIKF